MIELESETVFPVSSEASMVRHAFFQTRWRHGNESFHLTSPRSWAFRQRLRNILTLSGKLAL
jgi:hypothetical protein